MQRTFFRSLTWILAVGLLTGGLVGCRSQAASADDDPFVIAELFATPGKAIATVALSPTPEPTATLPNLPAATPAPTLPLPTVVILQQPTQPIAAPGPSPTPDQPIIPTQPRGCPQDPPMPFTPIFQNVALVRDTLGCPLGDARRVYGVWQAYQYGAMFWREDDGSIFVISNLAIQQGNTTDTWWRLTDTYQEGDPLPQDVEPPEGLIKPERGFGTIWHNNGFVREAVGWATEREIGYETLWQEFEGGWMMTAPGDSPIYVLAPLDDPPYSTGLNLGFYP
jgi:hypothetical protein